MSGSQDPTRMTLIKMHREEGDGKVFNPEMFMSKGRTGTNNGRETEIRAIQGLTQMGLYYIYRHQI